MSFELSNGSSKEAQSDPSLSQIHFLFTSNYSGNLGNALFYINNWNFPAEIKRIFRARAQIIFFPPPNFEFRPSLKPFADWSFIDWKWMYYCRLDGNRTNLQRSGGYGLKNNIVQPGEILGCLGFIFMKCRFYFIKFSFWGWVVVRTCFIDLDVL